MSYRVVAVGEESKYIESLFQLQLHSEASGISGEALDCEESGKEMDL